MSGDSSTRSQAVAYRMRSAFRTAPTDTSCVERWIETSSGAGLVGAVPCLSAACLAGCLASRKAVFAPASHHCSNSASSCAAVAPSRLARQCCGCASMNAAFASSAYQT